MMIKNSFCCFALMLVSFTANAKMVGFVTGDSFSNGPFDWPALTEKVSMHTTAIAGQPLVDMAVTYEEQLDQHIADYDIDFTVIQGGTNDVNSGSISLDMMYEAVQTMIDIADSRNIPVFVINIAPWTDTNQQWKKNHINFYNQWLEDTYKDTSVGVIDIYSLLEDPDSPTNILPVYDWDGLHVNALGYHLIADAVENAVIPVPPALLLFLSAIMAIRIMPRRSL